MSNITISSLNCLGFGNFKKKRRFSVFKRKKFTIYFLKDAHFTKKIKRQELNRDLNT